MNFLKHIFSPLLILGLLVLIGSCKDDSNSDFVFSIEPRFDGETFEFGKNYTNHMGQTIKFEFFKFYLSDIKLTNDNNETVTISDVELFDLEDNHTIEKLIPIGNYKSISFAVGLDSLTNRNSDPDTFNAEHPLSYAQNTHWGWASLYKFMQIEGRVDEIESDFLQKTFSYHTGFDELYRPITLEKSIEVTDDQNDFTLILNIDEVFKAVSSVDMFNENTSHSLTPVAKKLSDNVADSFEIK